ncbi:MAG: MFS transporter [Patescibacteria group bacterium]
MQKYIPLRVHTALYLSIFFLALHYVFVYFANSSILTYLFKFSVLQVLIIYGIASLFGVVVFLLLSSKKIQKTRSNMYIFTLIEMVCLATMYAASIHVQPVLFVTAFCLHHLITPYMLYNLDILFESYIHAEDRGRGRGIYLTMWNTPFVIVPLLLSSLREQSLPIVYAISFLLLLPFIFFVYIYLQDPDTAPLSKNIDSLTLTQKIMNFWSDKLDRKSFLIQSTLHLYYAITGVLLPIYLHSYFGFDWDKIGILLAITVVPFILLQIPFGSMEDRQHNEKKVFGWGLCTTIVFTVISLCVTPDMNNSFLWLALFLFISRVGCSLIEIATEGLFYKHVNERDAFALLVFRAGRIVPYVFGLIALFFI